jgi:hypothetical protein
MKQYYMNCSIFGEYRQSSTFVQPAFSYIINFHPLIHSSYAEFRLSYKAYKQTFWAIAQWHCKTEPWTVFCVYEISERLNGLRSASIATHLLRLWVWIPLRAWMSVCLWVLCVVKLRSLWETNHPSRGTLLSVACLRRGLYKATLHATCQRVQLPASEWAGSKLAMLITCTNEKAGQSAGSALVHHSTNQRWLEKF